MRRRPNTRIGRPSLHNYKLKRNRSLNTMGYSFSHLLPYFGENVKAMKLGGRLGDYLAARRLEGR